MGQNGSNGAKPVTQLQHARAGAVTDAMRRVAEKEDLPVELVRDEVARGRMIIPANVNHLDEARADGHRHECSRARSTRTSATPP